MKFSLILSALASFAIAADSVEVAAQAAGLTTLLEALDSINLTSTVVGLTNVTIFAPTNQAFEDVNVTLTIDLLTKILQLHIVPGILKSTDFSVSSASTVTALSNESLIITKNSTGGLLISSPGNVTANVVFRDLEVTQGIYYVINKILLPAPVVGNSAHGALVKGSLFFASACILLAL